ncbi:MAG: DUF2330 domain-containing protein [Bacteroidia bacterium]
MKKLLILVSCAACYAILTSFCGFYVAKADASLFANSAKTQLYNQASQVILVRQGDQTVVTMQSDFNGPVKNFAMVVPVPVIPREEDIRVADAGIFSRMDAYSGPRLVEYFDEPPCGGWDEAADDFGDDSWGAPETEEVEESYAEPRDLGVKVEATYNIGEYTILILGAKESDGLEKWLLREGYNIPPGAKEALDPYVKDGLKFFVVKVNLDEYDGNSSVSLRPIQVSYITEKFMLPIRLGMANAKEAQDMVVYILTDQGRAEVTNYRTVEMPTDRNIPTFVDQNFGDFYKRTFKNTWERSGRNVAILEYAWDISGNQSIKCDPCPNPPLVYDELREAGAFWLEKYEGWGDEYSGDLHMTRIHVRYDREHFPQDLLFQVTPNKTQFQSRYVLQRPEIYGANCEAGYKYLKEVKARRAKEIANYTELTNIVSNDAIKTYRAEIKDVYQEHLAWRKQNYKSKVPAPVQPKRNGSWALLIVGVSIFVFGIWWKKAA